MTSILNHPSVQLAGLILSALFFLNQTRQRGIVLSLICMVAWLGIVIIVVDMIREPSQELSVIVSRRVEIIDEIELIQLGPIINTETEQEIVITPNEQVQEAPQVTSSWGSVSGNVARWQPNIYEAITHCGLVTPGYDTALLMAAIVTQESSGNPNAMGKAHDTGLGQVVNNSHPLFPDRPSQAELLDPQFNLNFAACLLRDNLKRTGTVEAAINAYNGNGIHNGRTYAEIIFSHYNGFQPVVIEPSNVNTNANFGSLPVSGTPRITQHYGASHPGLDIVGNGDILAVMDGVVQYVGPLYRSSDGHIKCEKAGCLGGFSVVLNHGGGTFTIYGHNSSSLVKAGESVRAGQPIARMGSEGLSTGPHLHFELRKNEIWNGNIDWPWSRAYVSADNPTGYLP